MKSLVKCLVGLAAWSLPVMCQAPAYTISTIAGGGTTPYLSIDGGLATAAQLSGGALGVAADAAGNVYISSVTVWEVTPDGVIHAFAGNLAANGTYSGDGAAAVGAGFFGPAGLTLDAAGNLYIADALDARIRKVDGSGVITTVAGGGSLFGLAIGDGGPATSAKLGLPQGEALDAAGNLYIADLGNARVRMVDQTGNITTVAGGASPVTALITGGIGDGGPATSALLNGPSNVAVDSAGNLYIADSGNNRIRKVANGMITTIAGSGSGSYSGDGGPATRAGLSAPKGVAVDSAGNIYIADTGDSRIRMVTPDGTITTIAGSGQAGFSGDGGPATAATLNSPVALAIGADGVSIYVADQNPMFATAVSGCIRLLTPAAQ